VINIDDKYAEEILKASRAEENILCSCEGKNADYTASNICHGGGCDFEYAFKVVSEREVFDAKIPFVGRFSPINSLESIAVAQSYGIGSSELSAILPRLRSVDGRMEKAETGNAPFSVYIDYAHTPDALENILTSARETLECRNSSGRLIVLFGCGGDRDRGKRKEMGQIASRLADFVIVTSDNSRSEDPCEIISDIYKGIDKEKEHILIVERESAIRFAVSVAKAKDIVILAGKGHERYEIDKYGRHPFDERDIVKKAISERFG
jgi:UDP-N-acetylmuramoyl-L-alanyl-D-glutamate--2,6-diaminopimelate ligase